MCCLLLLLETAQGELAAVQDELKAKVQELDGLKSKLASERAANRRQMEMSVEVRVMEGKASSWEWRSLCHWRRVSQ